MENPVIDSAAKEFKKQKDLSDRAMSQLSETQFFSRPGDAGNSAAIIAKHMAGNMLSRWTDFLNADGEKAWRQRDAEFLPGDESRETLMKSWEAGWQTLLGSLSQLTDADLQIEVLIRGEPHSVVEAIHRQLAHYSHHSGQIVYRAKELLGSRWKTLSIAAGKSEDFNSEMRAKMQENT